MTVRGIRRLSLPLLGTGYVNGVQSFLRQVFEMFLSAGLSPEQPFCAHEENMLWER